MVSEKGISYVTYIQRMFSLRRRLVTTRLFSNLSCPSCHKPLRSNIPACTSCWSISPISSNISHHALFGLPYEPNPFSIHLPTLKQRFRQAQAVCHPDTWATRNPVCHSKTPTHVYSHQKSQQGLAHTLSSRLNEAYQCLSRPLSRAEYILERNGVPTTESDSLEGAPFMLKIMDAREAIDEATPEDHSEIEQLVKNTHG